MKIRVCISHKIKNIHTNTIILHTENIRSEFLMKKYLAISMSPLI